MAGTTITIAGSEKQVACCKTMCEVDSLPVDPPFNNGNPVLIMTDAGDPAADPVYFDILTESYLPAPPPSWFMRTAGICVDQATNRLYGWDRTLGTDPASLTTIDLTTDTVISQVEMTTTDGSPVEQSKAATWDPVENRILHYNANYDTVYAIDPATAIVTFVQNFSPAPNTGMFTRDPLGNYYFGQAASASNPQNVFLLDFDTGTYSLAFELGLLTDGTTNGAVFDNDGIFWAVVNEGGSPPEVGRLLSYDPNTGVTTQHPSWPPQANDIDIWYPS